MELSAAVRSLKIVFVAAHNCGRMVKEATALTQEGLEIAFLGNSPTAGGGAFSHKIRYDSPASLEQSLELLNGFAGKKIIHVHNEPSWMVYHIRSLMPDVTIIFDVHDSNYWRMPPDRLALDDVHFFDEDMAARAADALIFPSQRALDRHPKRLTTGKPTIVLPSANPQLLYAVGSWNYFGGLVSIGGHMYPGMDAYTKADAWRDYSNLYAALRGKKQVYAYSADFGEIDGLSDYYRTYGVELGKYKHSDMIKNMGRHDWSLIGNLASAPVWDVALPNKFFDAMAAGIPVMNLGCPEVADLVDKYGVGINVESVEEMLDRWEEHEEKRYNVILHRDKLSMEAYLYRLIGLYEELS